MKEFIDSNLRNLQQITGASLTMKWKWSLSLQSKAIFFLPQDGPGIPVRLRQLDGATKTFGECYITCETFEDATSDESQAEETARRNNEDVELFHLTCAGRTRFGLREYVPPENPKPSKKARQQESSKGGVNMDVDDETQRKAPENRREPERQEVFRRNGKEYNEFCALSVLKILCPEFKVSQHGSKKDLLKRLSRKVRENEAIETLATAQEGYETRIEPLSLPENERPSDEEVAYRNITHLPYKS